MPTVNIPVYLPDKDYVRYVKNKDKLNQVGREAVKNALEGLK